MNADLEFHIKNNYTWSKLPTNIKQLVGNSQKEYNKNVFKFSISNQLRFKGNIIRHVCKEEKKYYDELLKYSQIHLMLYPYHLSDIVVKGLRVTPFQYYISMMEEIMQQDKSYDSLPNFTAADCLRLLGIGRNQYIELMNQCRSSKRFFRRRNLRELLPLKPVDELLIEPWWMINPGYITEDDMKMVSESEKLLIDVMIDEGSKLAGDSAHTDVQGLYLKGLIYLDVVIDDEDYVIVPPLEGFVMNRVQGDYFETLLYKIFVSIDENTSISELSNVLQIDLQLVKNTVSMYCRLGFARKKNVDDVDEYHPSWKSISKPAKKIENCNLLITDFKTSSNENDTDSQANDDESSMDMPISEKRAPLILSNSIQSNQKRIGFLFDSTLTAFLMMGNLSPGLKSHAVTMFEVGKMSDEILDSFVNELDKVSANIAEGEAQRYFEHALTLRSTISILRYNINMNNTSLSENNGLGLDLIRCESLQSLDPNTCNRLLRRNYEFLVSMAPLSHEIRPISSCIPPHIGPAIPEVNSVWFKLFIYHITGYGPPSLLLVKGSKLKRLPTIFSSYDHLLVTTWGHDPGIVCVSNALITINDALPDAAVLLQVYCRRNGYAYGNENVYIPFPIDDNDTSTPLIQHPAIKSLTSQVDLHHICGYLTMIYFPNHENSNSSSQKIQESSDVSISSSIADIMEPLSPPVNGFKSKDSEQLLANELETLHNKDCDQDETKECDILKSSDDQIVESNPLTDWTLLNCSFGVPLFDGGLNESVCGKIISNGLCSSESLENLTQSSRKLCLRLLKFVSEHQLSLAAMDTKAANEDSSIYDISLPTKNLIFSEGKLCEWDEW